MEAARATERRVLRAHQQGERHDTEDPAVETHHGVEESRRIARGDQHQDTCHKGEDGDEATEVRRDQGAAAGNRSDDELRQAAQPRADQGQPARQLRRIRHIQRRRIVRWSREAEGRIAIGAKSGVAVETDTPRPTEYQA
jgi:hypothetical protein